MRLFVALVCFAVFVGCSPSEPELRIGTRLTADIEVAQTIEKYGRTWRLVGEATDHGGVAVTGTRIPQFVEWINLADSDNRLLVVVAPEDEKSSRWSKITREQKRINGKWVSEGIDRTVYRDGRVSEGTNRNGDLHGIQRFWSANGQLINERTYVRGIEHGKSKGWYDDGTPSYEAIYKNGKEVSGKAWREDGSLIDASN